MYYRSLPDFKSDNGYEIDSTWYPRVTSIVNIKAKPALYRYYAQQKSFEHAERAKEQSAREGTLVHEVVEAILAGEDPTIPPEIHGVVSEFKSFQEVRAIVPLKIEEQIVSVKHGYAGTLDVLAEIDGKVGVLDIKTSKGIYRDYGIQTAAYVEALHERTGMPELTRWILRLDQMRLCMNGCGAKLREKGGNINIKNGTARSYSCKHYWSDLVGEVELKELDNLKNDIQAFLAAKRLWEWEHEEWLSKMDYSPFWTTNK